MASYSADQPWLSTQWAQGLLGVTQDGIWGPSTDEAFNRAPVAIRARIESALSEASLSVYSVKRVTTTVTRPVVGAGLNVRKAAPMSQLVQPVPVKARNVAVRAAPITARTMNYQADEAMIRRSLTEAGITGISQENFIFQAKKESSLVANARERMPSAGFAKGQMRSFIPMSLAEIEAIRRQGERVFFEAAYGHLTSKGRELGNIMPGDGYLMRGAGAIQVTGRANWAAFERFSGIRVTADPSLANRANIAMAMSIWFWQKRVGGAAISVAAMQRIVNPGLARA